MVEELGIRLIQMMENAGRSLARLAQALLPDKGGRALALAGRGGNGGGVLTAARHLAGWGVEVEVVTTSATVDFAGVPARQLEIVQALGVTVSQRLPTDADHYDLLPRWPGRLFAGRRIAWGGGRGGGLRQRPHERALHQPRCSKRFRRRHRPGG